MPREPQHGPTRRLNLGPPSCPGMLRLICPVAGDGEVGERCLALGSFADAAGFRSIHSQRTAATNAPDRIERICRIVAADIGLHPWCTHPARAPAWAGASGRGDG